MVESEWMSGIMKGEYVGWKNEQNFSRWETGRPNEMNEVVKAGQTMRRILTF